MSRLKIRANVAAVALLLGVIGVLTLMFSRTGEAQVGSTPVRVDTPLTVTVTNPSGGGTGSSGLGPTKASDLVTLRSSGAVCSALHPSILRFDTQQNSDGTTAPFTIPTGSVLVVTGIDFRQGITGGAGRQEELFFYAYAGTSDSFSILADLMALGSSDGRVGLSTAITGAAIKSTACGAGRSIAVTPAPPVRCSRGTLLPICEIGASLRAGISWRFARTRVRAVVDQPSPEASSTRLRGKSRRMLRNGLIQRQRRWMVR